MASPAKTDEFLELVHKAGVTEDKRLDAHIQKLRNQGTLPNEPAKLAGQLIADGFLTHFQAEQLLQGKWRRFILGKYKILEPIGSGGMGSVYLCEHKLMRRRVAVKVLPPAKAKDESALARFYREARAVAALDHPNIVHAYDIDQDGDLHFLIMEYVDGASLQEIIKKTGPMDVLRACHYMRQSALGLEQAFQKDLVHRDIKPGNILVDRTGVVKILDMGLARFFKDEDDVLTRKFDENVLGTADYLAPEQIDDSHTVDIKADIYSLGATFYFVLTGKTLFGEGTIGQKLLWHQNRQPKPLSEVRPDVPAGLSAIITKMLSKAPEQRYQTPGEIVAALAPFTHTPIGPPPDNEMPKLSPAATGAQPSDQGAPTIVKSAPSPPPSTGPRKALQGMGSSSHKSFNPGAPSKPLLPLSAGSGAARAAAAAPPPTMPAQTAAPEEEAHWDQISSDTSETGALVDTGRDRKSHVRQLPPGSRVADVKEKKRLRGIMIGVGALFVISLGVGFVFLFKSPEKQGGKTRQPLQVSKNATGPHQYKTIRQALQAAAAGDGIELLEDWRENVQFDGRSMPHATDVTLRAAPGKNVVWTSASKDEKIPLLRLTNVNGFQLKGDGLTLDGMLDQKRRVEDLIYITFHCPGLVLEHVQLKSFGKSAVKIMNAKGDPGRPIRLNHLATFTTAAEKPQAAFLFDANDKITPPVNDHIEIGAGNQFNGLPAERAIDAKNTVMGKNTSGFPGLK